jgi:hypothetical protein
MTASTCRCCRYPCLTDGRTICTYCDGTVFGHSCPGAHGDRLQSDIVAMVRVGGWTAWEAVGAMAIDDARLTCTLAARPVQGMLMPWIQTPPTRWEVYVARRSWEGRPAAFEEAIAHALMRFLGMVNTAEVRAEMAAELCRVARALLASKLPRLAIGLQVDGAVVHEGGVTVEISEVVEGWAAEAEPGVYGQTVTPPDAAGPWVPRGKAQA